MKKPGVDTVLLAFFLGAPCMAADCLLPATAQPIPSLSLVAPEMLRSIVADPFCLSAQDALARIRSQAAGASGAYVPLTKDDNTPWRFDMSQNGKQMTSVEFDAWMKAKGIRVATGKAATAAAEPALPPPPQEGGR